MLKFVYVYLFCKSIFYIITKVYLYRFALRLIGDFI
nr:MAG TPA: hypothetical protein [Caudoviricetes sp.]